MKKAFVLVVGAVLALSGCAITPMIPDNHLQYILNSEPQGATVQIAGRVVGVTPVRLNIGPLTPETHAAKRLTTTPVTLTWKSGAQITNSMNFSWQNVKPSYFSTITVRRPAVAGLAQDETYAAQLIQVQQARAEQERRDQDARTVDTVTSIFGAVLGVAAAYQSGKNADTGTMYRESPPSSVTCRTREVGWQLVTKCE